MFVAYRLHDVLSDDTLYFFSVFFFKQKTAYEMRISDWSSDVCSSDLKTIGGPRSGFILTNDPDIAKKINSAVFPGQQGGPLMHVIAAKATAFKLAATPEFRERQERTIRGAAIIADRLTQADVAGAGIAVRSGGTDRAEEHTSEPPSPIRIPTTV